MRLARADATGLQASLDSPAQPMRRPRHLGTAPLSRLHRTWGAQLTWRRWPSPATARRANAAHRPAAGARARPRRPRATCRSCLPSVSQARRARRAGASGPSSTWRAHRRSRVATAGSGCSSGFSASWPGRSLASSSPPSRRTSPARATSSPPSPSSPPRPSGTSGRAWSGCGSASSPGRGWPAGCAAPGSSSSTWACASGRSTPSGSSSGWAARSSSGSCTCPSAATSTTSTARRPS